MKRVGKGTGSNMPIERPKILTAITVPTGGWDLDFDITITTQYDTNVVATVPAGTYYVAWDNQSDDLCHVLSSQMTADSQTAGKTNSFISVTINSDFTVRLLFNGSDYDDATGDNDVRINWTASASGLAQALGFDPAVDPTSTATDRPSFDGGYHHGYGWYADEDGWLEDLPIEDSSEAVTEQARAYSGRIKSQNMGATFSSTLKLGWITRDRMFSRGIGYGTTPVYPYTQNKGLEAWWQDALLGTQFRVYRDYQTTHAVNSGTITSSDTTTVTDSTKSWGTDPQEYKGMIALVPNSSSHSDNDPKRFRISSHSATALTSANASSDELAWYIAGGGTALSIYDVKYETYVVNLGKMKSFRPVELPQINRYKITIPLFRYVS